MIRNIRGLLLRAVTLAMASVLIASPAFAHQCFKTGWNETAMAGASASKNAWFTADDYRAFLNAMIPVEARVGECGDAYAAVLAELAATPENTLFMGPGALAGIDHHAGGREGARRPAQMSYLTTLHGVFINCAPPEGEA